MTDLERRALLGDSEAQRECMEKGIVLPCWRCGGQAEAKQEARRQRQEPPIWLDHTHGGDPD